MASMGKNKRLFVLQLLVGGVALTFLMLRGELQNVTSLISLGLSRKIVLVTLEIAAWLGVGWATSAVIDKMLWRSYEKQKNVTIPQLIKQIINSLIVIALALIIITRISEMPIAGLIAGSSVVATIIGLAVTKLISDVFSGGALSLERAYKIGDWLEIEMKSRKNGFLTGKVVEINWRSTHLHTKADELVIIPNSEMARMKLINFSKPKRSYRAEVQVSVSHTIPSDRMKRVLNAAIKSTPDVMTDPAPKITLLRFDTRGVLWSARFWISDFSLNRQVVKAAHESVLRHLQVAGIDLTYTPVVNFNVTNSRNELRHKPLREKLLQRIELFEVFGKRYFEALVRAMKEHVYPAKSVIIAQGETGSSVFILAEGLVNVFVKNEKGEDRFIAHIEPGQYFGEMSLLTGQPRAATVRAATEVVCYEIRKEDLEPILQESPQLIERISAVVAHRQQHTSKSLSDGTEQAKEVEAAKTEGWLVGQIKRFFGIAVGS